MVRAGKKKTRSTTRAAEPPATPPAPADGAPARRGRGRRPGHWPEGLGPADLEAYRERFGLSEKKLGDYLGVSVPTLRGWTKGGKAPTEDRHEGIRTKLAADYAEPERRAGTRPRAAGVRSRAGRATTSPTAEAAPVSPASTPTPAQGIAQLVAAYVASPGGQHLTPAQLLQLVERLRRTLD